MSNYLEYKGYIGSIEFSDEDMVFYGKVQGIRSLISYEGNSAKSLIKDFHEAVDDYLDLCAERGTDPERSYKGTFNIPERSYRVYRIAEIIAITSRIVIEYLHEFEEERQFVKTSTICYETDMGSR